MMDFDKNGYINENLNNYTVNNVSKNQYLRELILSLQKNNSQNEEIIKLLRKIKNLQKNYIEKNDCLKTLEDEVRLIKKFIKRNFNFDTSEYTFHQKERKRRRRDY